MKHNMPLALIDKLICHPHRRHYEPCRCIGHSFSVQGLDCKYIPASKGNMETPIILYCHGSRRNMCSCSHVAAFFHTLNVDVVLFDYSGFGFSVDRQDSYSPDCLTNDTILVIRYLQESFPQKRLYVYGHSLGAVIAMRAVASLQLNIAGLIVEGAFAQASAIAPIPWWLSWCLGIDSKYQPQHYLSLVTCPVFFAHSIDDQLIPSSQSHILAGRRPVYYLRGSHASPNYDERYAQELLRFIG